MQIYDISLPLSAALITWPGDPPITLQHASHLDRGDVATVTHLHAAVHIGTHVDAPAHFIRGGTGVDSLDLQVLIGPAWVVEALDADMLSAAVLAALPIPAGTERLLVHTRNSAQWGQPDQQFDQNFVAITADGAQWLVERGIKLVGVDYLSVAPFDAPVPTHEILLGGGIIPLEGLNLHGIEPGGYDLCCLPLKIVGGDGAPARAVLIKNEPPT